LNIRTIFLTVRGIDRAKAKTFLQKNDLYIIGVLVFLCGLFYIVMPYMPSLWTKVQPTDTFITAGQFCSIMGVSIIIFAVSLIKAGYGFRDIY